MVAEMTQTQRAELQAWMDFHGMNYLLVDNNRHPDGTHTLLPDGGRVEWTLKVYGTSGEVQTLAGGMRDV